MAKFPMGRRWVFGLVALGAAVGSVLIREWLAPDRSLSGAVTPTPRKIVVSAPRAFGPQAASPPAPGAARVLPADALFDFVRPANAPALDAALPAPARAIHYVELNQPLLAGKNSPFWRVAGQGSLSVPLPDGRALSVTIESSEMLGADRFASTGRIAGRPGSLAIFAYGHGFLHASIEDPELGKFVVRTATDTLAQFYEVDPALLAPCGGERRPEIDADALAKAALRRVAGAVAAGSDELPDVQALAAASNPQRAEVHVMMAYTQAVKSDVPGLSPATRAAALEAEFEAAIRRVNEVFAASLITARLKLVRSLETNYSADGAPTFVRDFQDAALTALQSATDRAMDEIHAARDASGADVVCLLLNRRDSASVGLSYVLDTPGDNTNPNFAFSVVEYASLAGTNVFAHELGHLFGCVHDRDNSTGKGAYPYSYGYRFTGANGQRYYDIMSYPSGVQLNYFSNPNVIVPAPVSAPIGIPAGQPGEADAARTIEQDAFELATFRLQTQGVANAGRLVNVSTRAFVGTGEQVLIGGFVINGSAPKRMLLRAAGPSMASAGVPNLLADPLLRLFSDRGEIAFSDNWSAQSDAAAVATTGLQVGAAPLVSNLEAALLLTLPPGPYTAIVEGTGGSTGSGIVEAFEVESSANKVVNLSTRGYADLNGRELIGGFVIAGVPGSTKRVLVRAMGPTLARADIAVPLEDPFFQIHNAAGDRVIQNDDWSTGAEGGVSLENDFRPLVRSYGEQQIFATGFAPANRREPCVLVDLPPGIYTVIVKPFEDLALTPPQPAKPGVTIIEVYEIAP